MWMQYSSQHSWYMDRDMSQNDGISQKGNHEVKRRTGVRSWRWDRSQWTERNRSWGRERYQAKENGLRGRSGERGLNAFAKRSSPDSALEVRVIGPIELREAKPGEAPACWACWSDSGGNCATGLRGSEPDGLSCELGVGVGFVSGVGKCDTRFAILRNELKEDTATSGDCGDSKCAGFGPG